MYKESYKSSKAALVDFSVDVIDTEDYNNKFDKKNQKIRESSKSMIQEVCELSSKEICKRLNFRDEELPNYEIFAPFSGIFFVVNFTLRENLWQKEKFNYKFESFLISHMTEKFDTHTFCLRFKTFDIDKIYEVKRYFVKLVSLYKVFCIFIKFPLFRVSLKYFRLRIPAYQVFLLPIMV